MADYNYRTLNSLKFKDDRLKSLDQVLVAFAAWVSVAQLVHVSILIVDILHFLEFLIGFPVTDPYIQLIKLL
jgi:hypothetical protein